MIACLRNISKTTHFGKNTYQLFHNLDMQIEDLARVGIMGGAKSGKSTLLRMICGTEDDYEGTIVRNAQISWPIPFANFLANSSTVAANVQFISRLYGVEDRHFTARVLNLAEISEFVNVKLQNCPPTVKQRLPFCLAISLDFDVFLFDNQVGVIAKDFKPKAIEIFKQRTADRAFILASAAPAEVEAHCESVFILEGGRAKYFDDVKEGVSYFKELNKALTDKQKKQEEQIDAEAESGDEAALPDGAAETELAESAIGALVD